MDENDIQYFLNGLSEDERLELSNTINEKLAELYETQPLEPQPSYHQIYYTFVILGICGVLVYVGYKFFTIYQQRARKQKLKKRVEKRRYFKLTKLNK